MSSVRDVGARTQFEPIEPRRLTRLNVENSSSIFLQ